MNNEQMLKKMVIGPIELQKMYEMIKEKIMFWRRLVKIWKAFFAASIEKKAYRTLKKGIACYTH